MENDRSRRAELIERLADHILDQGIAAASLRALAVAVGTSDRMLLYYFTDKAELLGAALGAVAERMTALLDAQRLPARVSPAALEAHLLPFVLDDTLWPFMALWLEVAGQSARGDPLSRQVGETIARGFLAWVASQINASGPAAREIAATRVLMRIEGAVLLKGLGLGDAVAGVAGAPPSRR